MQRIVSEEVLAGVARIGGRLGELRLDTDLDISHGVVRYLELLKLSALSNARPSRAWGTRWRTSTRGCSRRPPRCSARSSQTSTLDETLTSAFGGGAPAQDALEGAGRHGGVEAPAPAGYDERAARAQAVAPRGEPSLGPFLPRKGVGLALSASDIETYRSCPLRYKFARVLRIPDRADRAPALRHRRAPGARALSLRGRRDARADARRCSTPAGGGAGFGERRARARAAREGARRRSRATTRGWTARIRSPSGSSARSPSGSARTTCAGAWIASIACPAAASSGARASPRRAGRTRATVRADRLQDLAAEDRRAAARRHPAVAVRAGGARGLGARVLAAGLLLRARRPQGARAERRDRRRGASRRSCSRSGEGILAPELRADALAGRLLDLRLPHRLPGRGGVGATCPRARAGAESAGIRARACRPRAPPGRELLLAVGGLLQPFDERLDVGVALHGECRPGARSRRRPTRARRRRPRRRSAPSTRRTQRQRRLRVGGGGDVVGHGRPQARRRQPRVGAGGVQHADDAGRALVARARHAQARRPARGRRRSRSSSPGGCAGRRRAARRARRRPARRAPRRGRRDVR